MPGADTAAPCMPCSVWLTSTGALTCNTPVLLPRLQTFLFANVIASGIKIITSEGSLDRRTRFIMACALALGIGVELVPQWASANLWPVTPDMSTGVKGIHDAVILILDTSFCLGAIVAFILNFIMPQEAKDEGEQHGG